MFCFYEDFFIGDREFVDLSEFVDYCENVLKDELGCVVDWLLWEGFIVGVRWYGD